MSDSWEVFYTNEARNDLKKLDKSTRIQVVQAVEKTRKNPLPISEGGYGVPLGKKTVMI